MTRHSVGVDSQIHRMDFPAKENSFCGRISLIRKSIFGFSGKGKFKEFSPERAKSLWNFSPLGLKFKEIRAFRL